MIIIDKLFIAVIPYDRREGHIAGREGAGVIP